MTGDIAPSALVRVAIDQRPCVERMPHTTHLVLDPEQPLAIVDVNDVLKAILVGVALLGNQTPLREPSMGTRELGRGDLDMSAASRYPLWHLRFDKHESGHRPARHTCTARFGICSRQEYVAVKACNALGCARQLFELHIGNAQCQSGPTWAGCVTA